jgi:predicted TIM-barrel fold metal-dependent hydrolase
MDAPLPALTAMLSRLQLDRVVVVQPSFYATDNRCTLAALASLGGRARGVAVVDANISSGELDALHRGGIRGVRLNFYSTGSKTAEDSAALLRAYAKLCRRNGWHIQLFTRAERLSGVADTLLDLGVPVVLDHFALLDPNSSQAPELAALLRLLASGRIWIKISAPYRISQQIDDPRVASLARQIVAANPGRVVWGSDWPHTPVHAQAQVLDDREMPYRAIDTAHLLRMLTSWIPDGGQRDAVLVRNPAELYDFPASADGR